MCLTCECSRLPSKVTLCCSRFLSRTSSMSHLFGPSPPIKNFTFLWREQISGIICANRSTPFLYTNRDTITIVTKTKGYIEQVHRMILSRIKVSDLQLTVIVASFANIRGKQRGINSVWNNRHLLLLYFGSQYCILLSSMRYTYAVITIN